MSSSGLLYADSGVDTEGAQTALQALTPAISQSFALRRGVGRPLLPLGYFANVLSLSADLAIAISTDGVGTKAIVAQLLDKYDTIGIDCVAMNVNDVLCVGAEPIAITDYIAVEVPDPDVFRALGVGLLEGARQARVAIPGGEIAQIREMVRGPRQGRGFDLVGTCVGVVHPERILIGQAVSPGDVVVGLASSGIHSNGLSLARKALLEKGGHQITDYCPEFGRSIGEELLWPTSIYVDFAMDVLRGEYGVKAFAHITSDGLLNLLRVEAPVSYVLDDLPEPPPVFQLIRDLGEVPQEEMYRVFNMGIGFCAVVPPESADAVCRIAARYQHRSRVIGHVTADPDRSVRIPTARLIGRGDAFFPY